MSNSMIYSRRFRLGESRYMTRAYVEEDFVTIVQSERTDNPESNYHSLITLSIEDFKKMVKTLGLQEESK